ncbi:uncharacterized protein LOC144024108 isoform X3 [Festucalex cinctus]
MMSSIQRTPKKNNSLHARVGPGFLSCSEPANDLAEEESHETQFNCSSGHGWVRDGARDGNTKGKLELTWVRVGVPWLGKTAILTHVNTYGDLIFQVARLGDRSKDELTHPQ